MTGSRRAASAGDAPVDPSVALYKVAYEEGKRAVDDQFTELDSMRAKSVQFLAFSGGATAFLVAAGLKSVTSRDAGFYLVALLATALSMASIALAILMLLAFRIRRANGSHGTKWNFRLSSRVLVEDWVDAEVPNITESRFFRQLALRYDLMHEENVPNLAWMRRRYAGFLGCCALQVTAWSALVWLYG